MTVTGTLKDAKGTVRGNTRMRFIPKTKPSVSGSGVLTAIVFSLITASDGTFSLVLSEGIYEVSIGSLSTDMFNIVVGDSSSSVNIETLMLSYPGQICYTGELYLPARGVNYQIDNGLFRLINPDTNLANSIGAPSVDGIGQFSFDAGVSLQILWGPADRSGTNYRVDNLGNFQIFDDTNDVWRSVNPINNVGMEQLTFSSATETDLVEPSGDCPLAGTNFRRRNGYFQLLNLTTNRYQTIYPTGAEDALQLYFRAPET